jgi:hypothetical protein
MWENKNVYGNVYGSFPDIPSSKQKCLWKVSTNISIDICGKECGKIKMYGNIYGNFPLTFVEKNVGKYKCLWKCL